MAGRVRRQLFGRAHPHHGTAARTAPEDVIPVSVGEGPKPRAREEFGAARWYRLSMGHDQWVDPKWLLPMLCRAGDLTRRDIGMIRVMQDQTFVQIHESMADRFEAGLGPDRVMEGKCTVENLPGMPEGLDRPAPKPDRWTKTGDRKPYEKKPYAPRGSYGDKPAPKPHRKGPPREEGAERFEKTERPARKPAGEAAAAPKPRKAAPWAREGGHGAAAKEGKPAPKYGAKSFAKPGAKPAGKPGPKKPRSF